MAKDEYFFFWKTNGENGFCSQWYPSPFKGMIALGEDGANEERVFPTAEHWMMAQKAVLFGDRETAEEVLKNTETGSKKMAAVKSLGRKVKGFEEEKWVANRERIVYEGTLHKFEQNKELRDKLVSSGDKIIAEASPLDKIWGIGLGDKKAAVVGEKGWRGENLLGKALIKVRSHFK